MVTVSPDSTNRGSPSIVQYWSYERLPDDVAAQVATFAERNPDLRHRVVDRAGAQALIRSWLGEREAAAFASCAIPAMQADYFRYCAVLAQGGVYADVDLRCVSPLRGLLDQDASGHLFCRPETYVLDGQPLQRVNNDFLVFPRAGHPLLRLALDIATAAIEERTCERVWGAGENIRESVYMTVGPGVLTLTHFLNALGSFDRLVAVAAGTAAEPFMDLYREAIGDHDRVVEAFKGVRVGTFAERAPWVVDHEAPLAYKRTGAHWHNASGSIFADSVEAAGPRPG